MTYVVIQPGRAAKISSRREDYVYMGKYGRIQDHTQITRTYTERILRLSFDWHPGALSHLPILFVTYSIIEDSIKGGQRLRL